MILDILAGINYGAWVFVVLVGLAVAYLARLDRDARNPFKLYQFIADRDGTANSASLTYVGIFMVAVWLVWYLALNRQWGEAVTLVGSLGAIFVLGGVARQFTGARERVGMANASRPGATMTPATTETTTTTKTSPEG